MLPSGRSSYPFPDPRGGGRTVTVHTHRPAGYGPDSPILMVVHGRARNGADYRDYFVPESDRRGFLVVAPEFDEAQYPNPYAYNYGNMVDANGNMQPRGEWLFPVLDAVFRDVRQRVGSRRDRFFLFGHSAGSQLVHRMATFGWLDSIERAVAANAGSYTLPVHGEAFPFGLDGSPASEEDLRRLFSRPIIVQLGDSDVDPNDTHLPREPGAMRQGPYRFARGRHYFATAQREAERLGVPLAWHLAIVPGVAHSGQNMAPHAARELFGNG
jgi:poly(3-hydroxybutyrate) depolymerase